MLRGHSTAIYACVALHLFRIITSTKHLKGGTVEAHAGALHERSKLQRVSFISMFTLGVKDYKKKNALTNGDLISGGS